MTPKTVVPGTDCPLPGTTCDGAAALDTAREAAEGEAFKPTGNWTLTDVYDGGPYYTVGTNASSNFGELGVAAESTQALVAPTELFDTQTQAAAIADRKKWNDAHRIVVDDGSSSTTTRPPTTRLAVPVDDARPTSPRVGAAHHLPGPDDPDPGLQPVAAAPEQSGRGRAVGHPAAAAADPGGQRGPAERRR